MTARHGIAVCVLGAALAFLLPLDATAAAGGGILSDADPEKSTVTVGERVMMVGRTSEILDVSGEPLKLHEIEGELGEWVFYRSAHSRAGELLEWLQLAPDDE